MRTIKDALREDADYLETASVRLAGRCDIWQDRTVYALCVAVLHLIRWALSQDRRDP